MSTISLALRRLTTSPAFSAAVGLNAAITAALFLGVLSVVDRILLAPLPYDEPHRLVQIRAASQGPLTTVGSTGMTFSSGGQTNAMGPTGGPTLRRAFTLRLRESASAFEDIAWARGASAPRMLAGFGDKPVAFQGVTYNLLRTIGVTPIIGRDFTEEDARARSAVVIISHQLWVSRFGRSTEVLSRSAPGPRIVGVLPSDFILPSPRLGDAMDGLVLDWDRLVGANPPPMTTVAPIARLRPGVTLAAARQEAASIIRAVVSAEPALVRNPDGPAEDNVVIEPLESVIFRPLVEHATLTLVAVAVVLVLGVANIAILVTLRAGSTKVDAAVRIALGASPAAVLSVPLVESLVLCGAGVAIGVACFGAFGNVTTSLIPDAIRLLVVSAIDPRLLTVAAVIVLVAATVSVAGVALQLRRTDTYAALREQIVFAARSPRRSMAAQAALALQMAMSIALVGTALLAVGNFRDLSSRGLDYDNLTSVSAQYGRNLSPIDRRRAVLETVRRVPGVVSGAAASSMPYNKYLYDDRVWTPRGIKGAVWGITDELFDTLRIRVLAGRGFTNAEQDGRARVAVINERAAPTLFSGVPLPRIVGQSFDTDLGPRVVVGIVENTKPGDSEVTLPGVFVPFDDPVAPETGAGNVSMAVRTQQGALLDTRALEAALNQRLGDGSVLATLVEKQILPRKGQLRFLAALLAALAVGVLVVSATGVYAATASAVSSRYREFAIRVTLGARVRNLVSLLMRAEIRSACVGAVAGLAGCFWLARLLRGSLMGGSASALLTNGMVVVILGSAALLAMWWPVLRIIRRMGGGQGLVDALK